MKYLLPVFIMLFNCSYSQSLNAVQIQEISNYSFVDLDRLMVTKYKFSRMHDLEDDQQKIYSNDSDQADKFLVITVIKEINACANILSIVNSSEAEINKLKEDLPSEGFVYRGKKKMTEDIMVSQFVKEKITISITDSRTSTGAYQILWMCK